LAVVTVIAVDVSPPGAHRYVNGATPVAELAVSTTLPPAQNVVGPLGVITAVGSASTVTVVPGTVVSAHDAGAAPVIVTL
jgi:hypothetical protein